mmetsp:Transcript_29613/g.75017  ORF Transcript_29613/g.75017 Transcript_29613/m.75017 type:complete len:98 (-) Transcript_29613:63-356(-)
MDDLGISSPLSPLHRSGFRWQPRVPLLRQQSKTNYELVHFFDLWKQVGTPDSPHSWAYAWLPKDKMIGFAEGLERHGKRAGKQLKEAVEVAQGLIGV